MRNYQNGPPQQGQMFINMKTTVTTSGGQHNGLVVHSAIQSAGPSTSSQNWMSPYIESPTRELMRSNSSINRIGSPLPIQMVPSTSRETLVSSSHRSGGRRESRASSPHVMFREQRPPSPPPSPIYSFKGRDSPPDEFIQPTKLILNVFQPTHREPSWRTPISQSYVTPVDNSGGISLSRKNALLNDELTTTTTVEVFRAPMDETPVIALPPAPIGNGQPLLVRTHGSSPYESWTSSRTQPLPFSIDNEPINQRAVQWKEGLVEGSRYRNNYDDSDSYEEIPYNNMPHPDAPQIIHHDYRPIEAQRAFQPTTHPILSGGSRDDLRFSQPEYRPRPTSPLYVIPDRKYLNGGGDQRSTSVSPGYRRDRDDYRRERDYSRNEENPRYHHRRSRSSAKEDAASGLGRSPSSRGAVQRTIRHRSMSPSQRSRFGGSQEFVSMPTHSPIGSTLMLASPNPNELPGRPASARSQETYTLYQTRDAYNRVVDQL